MSHPTPITVGIADDHFLFKKGMQMALSYSPDIQLVMMASNGMDLLSQMQEVQPDIILLDLHMPVLDGLRTLPELKRLYPEVKVIILTMTDEASVVWKIMELGASSYLLKNCEPDIIIKTIKECYNQELYINDLIKSAGLSR